MRATLCRYLAARLLDWSASWECRADRIEGVQEAEIEIPVMGAPPGTVSRIRHSDLERALARQRAEAVIEAERMREPLFVADGSRPWRERTIQ